LRRFIDEPLAVADRDGRHMQSCARCRARHHQISTDAAFAERALSARVSFSDPDLAWARHQAQLARAGGADRTAVHARRPRYWRLMGTSAGTGAALATAGAVLAGVATAATLSTTVFAPTKVAPVAVSGADLRAVAGLLDVQSPAELLGFSKPAGAETLPFGSVHWTSTGEGHRVSSLRAAEASTGLSVNLPSTLPNGVGTPNGYFVIPTLTATVVLGHNAGDGLAGSSLVATLGPGIGITYSGTSAFGNVYPLAILTVARPLATSSGATTSQLERFLLSRPEIPPDLAQGLQLLGNLKSTLPVPTPRGANSTKTEIAGYPAVLLSDKSNDASAVVWESANGEVHIVAGLLDKEDLRSVAEQVR
jgi:hypothetical protein